MIRGSALSTSKFTDLWSLHTKSTVESCEHVGAGFDDDKRSANEAMFTDIIESVRSEGLKEQQGRGTSSLAKRPPR